MISDPDPNSGHACPRDYLDRLPTDADREKFEVITGMGLLLKQALP